MNTSWKGKLMCCKQADVQVPSHYQYTIQRIYHLMCLLCISAVVIGCNDSAIDTMRMYRRAIENGDEELAVAVLSKTDTVQLRNEGLGFYVENLYPDLVEAARYEVKMNKNWDQIFHTALTTLHWDEESSVQKKDILAKPFKYQRILRQLVWPQSQPPPSEHRMKAWQAVCNWPKDNPTSFVFRMYWQRQSLDSEPYTREHREDEQDSLVILTWGNNYATMESTGFQSYWIISYQKMIVQPDTTILFTIGQQYRINKKLYEFSQTALEAVKRAGTIREFRELIRTDLEEFDTYWSQQKYLSPKPARPS